MYFILFFIKVRHSTYVIHIRLHLSTFPEKKILLNQALFQYRVDLDTVQL